jgi:hypothetical protein
MNIQFAIQRDTVYVLKSIRARPHRAVRLKATGSSGQDRGARMAGSSLASQGVTRESCRRISR